MAMEQTYLMVKPDGVQRGLCGEILSRFEKKGLKIVAMKMMVISKETAENHYGEHKGKPFFPSLIPSWPWCSRVRTRSPSAGE